MSFSREMKASGRQEFVIQTSLKLDEAATLATSCLMSNYVGQICHGRQLSHISGDGQQCARLTEVWKFLDFIFPVHLWLLNKVSQRPISKIKWSYQAVHFGVGNIVGLLGSYLKWTNKMSALFSHVLIWGFRLYHYELTLCQRRQSFRFLQTRHIVS